MSLGNFVSFWYLVPPNVIFLYNTILFIALQQCFLNKYNGETWSGLYETRTNFACYKNEEERNANIFTKVAAGWAFLQAALLPPPPSLLEGCLLLRLCSCHSYKFLYIYFQSLWISLALMPCWFTKTSVGKKYQSINFLANCINKHIIYIKLSRHLSTQATQNMACVDGHRDEFTYIILIYFHNFPLVLILWSCFLLILLKMNRRQG